MANGNVNGEMCGGPQSNRWYPLRLGSSLVDHSSSTKFCTLRYEFKPASIDKTQPGTLHKSKENRVSVEFHNNQPGKPKVAFEGSSEDYKDTDAVLFFDGDTFQLEKLHRAFKSLKHKRVPGDSNSLTGLNGAGSNGGGCSAEAPSPPPSKVARTQAVNRASLHALPVEVEKIDIGGPENNAAAKQTNNKGNTTHQSSSHNPFSPPYRDTKPYNHDQDQDHDIHLDILGDDEPGTPNRLRSSHHTSPAIGFDINVPNHHAESDDDIDLFDDMPAENDGLSAAEALRAQVTGSGTGDAQFEQGDQGQETSSSGGESSSSGSSSASGSGSGSSSSSGSEGSDADGGGADSASSAGDIDIF